MVTVFGKHISFLGKIIKVDTLNCHVITLKNFNCKNIVKNYEFDLLFLYY